MATKGQNRQSDRRACHGREKNRGTWDLKRDKMMGRVIRRNYGGIKAT